MDMINIMGAVQGKRGFVHFMNTVYVHAVDKKKLAACINLHCHCLDIGTTCSYSQLHQLVHMLLVLKMLFSSE